LYLRDEKLSHRGPLEQRHLRTSCHENLPIDLNVIGRGHTGRYTDRQIFSLWKSRWRELKQ
jgi:hypothetical protein